MLKTQSMAVLELDTYPCSSVAEVDIQNTGMFRHTNLKLLQLSAVTLSQCPPLKTLPECTVSKMAAVFFPQKVPNGGGHGEAVSREAFKMDADKEEDIKRILDCQLKTYLEESSNSEDQSSECITDVEIMWR